MILHPPPPPAHTHTFWPSLRRLMGHMVGSAVLFLALALIPWGLGAVVESMDKIQAFNPTVKKIIEGVEFAIMMVDIGVSGFLLLVGAGRFCRDVWIGG